MKPSKKRQKSAPSNAAGEAAAPLVEAVGIESPGAGLSDFGANSGGIEAKAPVEPLTEVDAETRSKRAFFGRSGHLAVMAELLHRGINVAIPEVDVGDDVFVVKGISAEVIRVQVKAATSKPGSANDPTGSYSALVNVPEDQLKVPQDNPPLVYVFPIRRGEGGAGRWSDYVVIGRGNLHYHYDNEKAGRRYVDSRTNRPYVQFKLVFTADAIQAGDADLQPYRNAWEPWPPPTLPAKASGGGAAVSV